MNKQNLIRLGSVCQKKFDMRDDYKYMELPDDNTLMICRIPIPVKNEWNYEYRLNSTNFLVDEIQLERIIINDNSEIILAGYGKASNTLVVQEVKRRD